MVKPGVKFENVMGERYEQLPLHSRPSGRNVTSGCDTVVYTFLTCTSRAASNPTLIRTESPMQAVESTSTWTRLCPCMPVVNSNSVSNITTLLFNIPKRIIDGKDTKLFRHATKKNKKY